MNTQGIMRERPGRGIGFQVNTVVIIGVALMVAIIVSFIAYMSFNALLEAGKREKMLDNQLIAGQIEQRYLRAIRMAHRMKEEVAGQFSRAVATRDRVHLIRE